MKLDRNSIGTIAIVYLAAAAAVFLSLRFIPFWWLKFPLVLALLWVCLWQTMFHMVPKRQRLGSASSVSAVSDGIVVNVQKIFQKEYLDRECLQVSVYMDFWDFHANFWPLTGTVTYYKYHPGKHFLAFKPKASEDNEHTCTAIRNEEGREVLFKQIAGGFARRIVCYAKDGLAVEAGDQCGIIKFGSRIDYFLPLDACVTVKPGDEVRAAETIIAEL